jgi:CO/xanthine dehydrogenase Mo-binding subunit
VYGNATYEASVKAREEIKKAAAKYLRCAPEELILADGTAFHKKSRRRLTYAQVVETNGSAIQAQGYYNDMTSVPEASMCAQVAEVEVDEETGEVKLRKIISAHSTGTVLNPLMHQGQIDGGVMMGVGYGLMEQVVLEDGKVATTNFGDYKIPTMKDIPVLKTAVLQMAKGPGPYGSMSIGETPNIPVAAAIANAVEDATRVRIKSLPITAEKVLAGLRGA